TVSLYFSLFLTVSHCFSLFLAVSRCFSLFLTVSLTLFRRKEGGRSSFDTRAASERERAVAACFLGENALTLRLSSVPRSLNVCQLSEKHKDSHRERFSD